MKLAGHLASVVCLVVAGFAAYACGSDSEDPASPDGGGASSSSGTLGEGGTGGEGGTSSGGIDTCGGAPCANHMGPKEFSEQGVPSNAPSLFGAPPRPNGTDPTKEPRIVYPNHETMFPINVSHIRHEWTPAQNDLFRLVFEGPKTKVTIYTTTKDWEPSDEQWDWIAESNRGNAVKLTVSGIVQAAPQDVWQSQTIDLHFSPLEVEGALYY